MEIEGERYSEAIDLLRTSLEICRSLMDAEVDRETALALRAVIKGLEDAITIIEAERRAIPLHGG